MFERRLRCIFRPTLSLSAVTNRAQDFCKEVVTWKYLDHPNVLPLLGVTIEPLQLVSNWVSGGSMQEYIEKHPDADRRRLVGVPFVEISRLIILSPVVRRR